MLTRRSFLRNTGVLASGLIIGCGSEAIPVESQSIAWRMPDEADPHLRTWMAFGASEDIWGKRLLPEVQRNLATIAKTIAKYEPVSMLVNEDDLDTARKLVGDAVELFACLIDDLWIRDTGPVFVTNKKTGKAGVDFNFNGWGKKQEHGRDAKVADFVTKKASVERIRTKLVLEGGGIEVDGHGTAIISESCVLNPNRNPGVSKSQCEAELKKLLGLEKIIWLPGIKGKDITDGHTDFYARFARPGVVLAGYDPDPDSYDHKVTKENIEILRSAVDPKGQKLEVIVLEAPQTIRKKFETDEFAAGYIGFYACNGAIIAQEFGDKRADTAARESLERAFPKREIVQINIDGIAAGGGSIHCATQQEPKV